MRSYSPSSDQQPFDAISTLPCTPSPLLPSFPVLALLSSMAAAIPAISPKPLCIKTYTVPKALPCDTLGAELGLSQADILSLNSGLSCDGPIPAGKVLCIKKPKQESTRKWPRLAGKPKKPVPACKTYATATDTTCDALASKFGLAPEKFIEYNDDVNSDCTNLVPGQAYCVALD
ncbi:hypothetical protein EDB87DRAFT_1418935 [Lactarius vividus]|nr:hypothetical protein EDB87DRAFT_1418935 [Lactarius vividus]